MLNASQSGRSDGRETRALGTRSQVMTLALLTAILFGIYLCSLLALPFLPSLVWAITLAVVFTPFQRWLEAKLKYSNLAAAITVLLACLILIVAIAFVGQRLYHEAGKGTELIKAKIETGEWRQISQAHPRLAPLVNWIDGKKPPELFKSLASWMSTIGARFIKGSVVEAIELILTFYLFFFILRDRRAALRLARSLSPLSNADMERLFDRVGDTIYATIYGTLTVSVIQGLLGGLMFWWLDLPAPLLWGVIMAFLALVPALGAFIVWMPAVLYLAMDGSWMKALILAIWGAAVVGTVDNLLRPILTGKRLKIHTVFVFISVFGGMLLFGPMGLILGPVLLTITQVLLEIWHAHHDADPRASERSDAIASTQSGIL